MLLFLPIALADDPPEGATPSISYSEGWFRLRRACELGYEQACVAVEVAPLPRGACPEARLELGEPGRAWVAGEETHGTDEELVAQLRADTTCRTSRIGLRTTGEIPVERWANAARDLTEGGDRVYAVTGYKPDAWAAEEAPAIDCSTAEECLAPVRRDLPWLYEAEAPETRAPVLAEPGTDVATYELHRPQRPFELRVAGHEPVRLGPGPMALGALDKEHIDAVIRSNISSIQGCYLEGLERWPELEGDLMVKFVIAADGSVDRAEIKSTTLGNPGVELCVGGVFETMLFDEPNGGGIVIVSYPFVFQTE